MGKSSSKANKSKEDRFEMDDDFFKVHSCRPLSDSSPFKLHQRLVDDGYVTRVTVYSADDRKDSLHGPFSVKTKVPLTLVVLDTDVGIFVSIEKQKGGFYVYESEDRSFLVNKRSGESSALKLLVEDDFHPTPKFSQFMCNLKRQKDSFVKDDVKSFHFAMEVFNEIVLSVELKN